MPSIHIKPIRTFSAQQESALREAAQGRLSKYGFKKWARGVSAPRVSNRTAASLMHRGMLSFESDVDGGPYCVITRKGRKALAAVFAREAASHAA